MLSLNRDTAYLIKFIANNQYYLTTFWYDVISSFVVVSWILIKVSGLFAIISCDYF